jgi:hypothetical protein
MNSLKLAALAVLMTFGAAVAQEVEKKMEIKVIVGGDGSDQASAVQFSSDSMDFDMQDLQVGETRAIASESGETVTITRVEEGFSFDLDGNTVMMPPMGELGSTMALVDAGAMHRAIDVDVDSAVHVMAAHHPQGVTIVSGEPLDQSVKDSIRSVLISAGNNEDVTFIDDSQDGQRVMLKKIQVINQ